MSFKTINLKELKLIKDRTEREVKELLAKDYKPESLVSALSVKIKIETHWLINYLNGKGIAEGGSFTLSDLITDESKDHVKSLCSLFSLVVLLNNQCREMTFFEPLESTINKVADPDNGFVRMDYMSEDGQADA